MWKGGKTVSQIINGNTNNDEIIQDFTTKFLYSSSDDNFHETKILEMMKEKWKGENKQNISISANTFMKIASSLNNGIGHDQIHSKLLKNASNLFVDNMVVFINSCFYALLLADRNFKG